MAADNLRGFVAVDNPDCLEHLFFDYTALPQGDRDPVFTFLLTRRVMTVSFEKEAPPESKIRYGKILSMDILSRVKCDLLGRWTDAPTSPSLAPLLAVDTNRFQRLLEKEASRLESMEASRLESVEASRLELVEAPQLESQVVSGLELDAEIIRNAVQEYTLFL